VQAVLNALSDITDVEVISSPHLLVLDNEQARLQVGDQVPALSLTAEDPDFPDGRVINQVQYFDTGVILEVTPRVNASGLVTLEISQEVSDAIGTTIEEINSPTIQQRRIESIVAVQSGETVALGGLIRERAEEGETGVPLLMDIPVLGNLFKTTTRGNDRTELLVLITPRVIRGVTQARAVTQELRERLSTLRDLVLPETPGGTAN
jgi:general secretion pathway protein D